jgi:phosphatidylinositol kinase/protein kinase (PI-3  family)
MNPIFLEGVFSGVMNSCALCFTQYKDQLKHHLASYLWDELMARNSVEDVEMNAEKRKQSKAIVEANVNVIMTRIKSFTTPMSAEKVVPLNKRVVELVSTATDSENISQMNPNWQPWF